MGSLNQNKICCYRTEQCQALYFKGPSERKQCTHLTIFKCKSLCNKNHLQREGNSWLLNHIMPRKDYSFYYIMSPFKAVRNLEFIPEEIESAREYRGKLFRLSSNQSKSIKTIKWHFNPSKLTLRALAGKRVPAQMQRNGHTRGTLLVAM